MAVAVAVAVLMQVVVVVAGAGGGGGAGKPGPRAPALVVFGDSIVDPGNNNGINTIVKADFPPYGHDFQRDHRPTGRFCNGRIPTDFIASRLGLKELLPAYLSTPELGAEELLTGVSFASGGTGLDPLTSQLASVISMPEQLRLFGEYREKVRAAAGDARVERIMSEGIFAVCAGSDDVANTYFTMRARSTYDHASYAQLLVSQGASFLESLLAAGARRIAVIGIPPIGCVPSQRTLSGGAARACSAPHNEVAGMFNAGLARSMEELRRGHPGARLVFMDIYGFLLDMMTRPGAYGFKDAAHGCCGTGLLEVSVLCNGLTSAVCPHPEDHLFWDSYHPTEKAYRILADFVYDNYIQALLT